MATSATLTRSEAVSLVTAQRTTWVDWEAPAAGATCRSRAELPRYVYRGSGDAHWLGQPCELLERLSAGRMCEVVFACGCRATVAAAGLALN